MKFLIVDSDRAARARTVDLLREAHPAAEWVEAGASEDYRRALQGEPVDLVLTDQALDWGDGLAVLREVRSRWPDVPVILVTALGGEDLLLAGLRAGIDDYVAKDRLEELVPAIQRALGDSREAPLQRQALVRALKLEQGRLAAVLDHLPVGVWIADAKGQLVSKNREADRIWAGDAPLVESVASYPQYQAWDPETGDRLQPESYPVARALRTGQEVGPVELHVRRFDGSEGDVLVSATPIKDDRGQVTGVVGINVDVTNRKRNEEALRESEQMFRFVATNVPDTLFFQDLDLRYTWIFNPAEPLETSHVVGRTDADLLPAEEAEKLTRIKRQVIETGEGTRVEIELSPVGIPRWYEAVYEPSRDAAGKFVGVVSYSRDITPRKRAEAARERLLAENRLQRELLERVLEAVPAAIAVIRGPEYRYELVNSAHRAIPGMPDVDFVGRTVDEVIPERVDRGIREALDIVFATDKPLSFREIEGAAEMGIGDTYWDVDHVPLHDVQGRVSGVLVVAYEVTDHVVLLRAVQQQAAELDAVLDSIADGVLVYGPHAEVRRMNPAAQAILRYSPQVREEDFETRLKRWRIERADGTPYAPGAAPAARALSGQTVRGEVMALRSTDDGATIWVSAGAAPLVTESGEVQGAVASFSDITALVQARDQIEQANTLLRQQTATLEAQATELEGQNERLLRLAEHLTAEQARLRATLSALPVAVVIADAEGHLIERNARYFDIWGEDVPPVTPAEGGGAYKGWWADSGEPLTVEDWPLWRALYAGDVVAGEAIDFERFDGTCGTMLNSAAPIRDDGGRIIGAVAVLYDITERRRAEAELQRTAEELEVLNQANRTLLQEINHRVKNTLTGILSLIYSERARLGRTGDGEALEALQRLAERVGSLAAAHTLLSAGGWRPLELDTLAGDVIQAATPDTRCRIDVRPTSVRVTPEQAHNLALVLGELTTNTAKYGQAGRVEIRVDVAVGDGQVCLTYRDRGPGYPDAVLAGDRRSVGLGLVDTLVTHSLRGAWSIRNDNGAVTKVCFPAGPDLGEDGP